MRLDKAKDCSIQKYLETSSEHRKSGAIPNSLKRERSAVLPDKVACNRLYDTLPAVCIKKVYA